MPIADRTLQSWDGVRRPQPMRWLVITSYEFEKNWKRKGVQFLGRMSIALFLFVAVGFYVVANADALGGFPLARFITEEIGDIDATFYYQYLMIWQTMPIPVALFMAVAVGAGSIADDLKHQALPLYLARAISPWDYVLGKGAAISIFTSAITFIPTALLVLLNAYFREDWKILFEQAWILSAIIAYGIVFVGSTTLLVLALSSLHKNSRYAMVTLLGFFYVSEAVSRLLQNALTFYDPSTQTSGTIGHWGWISIYQVWERIAATLFKMEPRFVEPDVSIYAAILMLGVIMGVCLLILRQRVRALEVVK